MRLRRLNLTRYGCFTDFAIDFGEPPSDVSDFHIIYGDNEAGKSTAFNGYLDLLFGIEERSKYSFLHDYSALRVGAVLGIDGQEVELSRIKRRDENLLGEADRPIDPTILTSALHGLSREAYQTMFSLNDETLEQGGEEILASKGDLGRLLFAATAGLGDLSDGLHALRERAATFYVPRSRSSELKTLKDELGQLDDQRRRLDTQASAFERLTETRRQAEEAYNDARKHRDSIRVEHARLSEIKDAFVIRDELIGLEAKLEPLAHLPIAPAGWAAEVGTLKEASAAAVAKRGDAEADIEAADEKLETHEADPAIIAARDELTTLEIPAARDRTAREDLPKRCDELLKVNAKLEELRRRLGAKDGVDSNDLIISDDRISLLDDLSAEEPTVVQRVESAREELSNAEDASQLAKEDLEASPNPSKELVALASLLDQQQKDDAQLRLEQAEDALSRLLNATERDLQRLVPWTGSEEDLNSSTFPSRQQADRWSEAAKRLARQLSDLKARQAQHAEARSRNAGIVSALSVQDGVIADVAASNTRKRRDEAWKMHRSRLDDETADAFEHALEEDDRVRDERLTAADRLADLRTAEIEIAAEEATLETIESELATVRGELNALRNEMTPVLVATGLPTNYPAEDLPDWLERAERLRDSITDANDHLVKRDRASAECSAQRSSLKQALTALGEQLPEDLDLDQLRVRAKTLRDRTIEDKARFDAAEKALSIAKEQTRLRDKALAKAKEAFGAWQTKWMKAFEGLWLGEREGAQMRALLDPLRDLATQVGKRAELKARIDAMEKDRRDFKNSIDRLAAKLGIEEQTDPATMHAHLHARLNLADKVAIERSAAVESRSKAEERLNKANSELSRIKTRMTEMAKYFPAHETITSLDELTQVLFRAERKAQLAEATEEKASDLMQRLGVDSRQDANAKLDAEALTEVESRLAGIGGDLEEADGELEERIGARRDAARALEEIGGDAAVALLDEKRGGVLIEISEKADRAIALQLGVMAADRALAAYRDRHRSELMARTAEAFRMITGGEFNDLKTQPDRSGDRLIALRSNGAGSIGAEEMSKGTRFQLYLALRLAGYRRFCELAGPLPFVGDDVIETFDDHRAAATIRLLGEIAKDGQALYFTHHNHLCDIAEKALGNHVTVHEIPK